jgi:hypothetical protein
VWNGIEEFQWAAGISYLVPLLQLLAAPLAALAGHWLWRRNRRALAMTAVALTLATGAGVVAAWVYALEPDRTAAALGALGGGALFTGAVLLLAHLALKPGMNHRMFTAENAANAESAQSKPD